MLISRRRLAGIFVALGGAGALTVVGAPVVRDALADRALEAEWRARAERLCPQRPASDAVPARPTGRPALPLAASGQLFVSHGFSKRVSIVDLATGRVTTLAAGVDDPHEVAVSPDGRWGVAADFGDYQGNYNFDGHKLAVFDLAAKKLARIIDLGAYRGPHDVWFLPGSSSRLVVTTQTSRHVVEVDVEAGRVVGATETRAGGSHNLAVAADGRTAYTANEGDASVSRLDLASRAFVAKYQVGTSAEGIAVTPDGREAWVGHRKDSVVRVVDGASGAVLATLPGFVNPDRLTISPDGRRAVIADFGCRLVRVVDVASRRELGAIAGLEGAGAAKVLPDNRVAVVAMNRAGAVVLVDIEARRVLARHELGRRLDAAAWGPTRAP